MNMEGTSSSSTGVVRGRQSGKSNDTNNAMAALLQATRKNARAISSRSS